MSSIVRITRPTPALVRAFGTTPARRFPSDTLDKPGKPASMNPSYVPLFLFPWFLQYQPLSPAGKIHNRSRGATNLPTISSLIRRNRARVARPGRRRLRGAPRNPMRPRSRSVIRPRAVTSWIRRDLERCCRSYGAKRNSKLKSCRNMKPSVLDEMTRTGMANTTEHRLHIA